MRLITHQTHYRRFPKQKPGQGRVSAVPSFAVLCCNERFTRAWGNGMQACPPNDSEESAILTPGDSFDVPFGETVTNSHDFHFISRPAMPI
jgi:hypothetical protein